MNARDGHGKADRDANFIEAIQASSAKQLANEQWKLQRDHGDDNDRRRRGQGKEWRGQTTMTITVTKPNVEGNRSSRAPNQVKTWAARMLPNAIA